MRISSELTMCAERKSIGNKTTLRRPRRSKKARQSSRVTVTYMARNDMKMPNVETKMKMQAKDVKTGRKRTNMKELGKKSYLGIMSF